MGNQEIEVTAVGTEQHPCSRCGAKLDFAPGTSTLKCPYCGFESEIVKSEAPITELDYKSYLENAGGEKGLQETQRVHCAQCGAETTLPADTAADICPFCGANMVFSGTVSRLIKPEGLLPFGLTQKEAFDCFRRWLKKLWFAPGKLKKYAQAENKLAGVYLPFWTYDSATLTPYSGERGDYYYTTEQYSAVENGRSVIRTRRVRHTRWTPAAGTVGNSFDDLLVPAGKSLPQKYLNLLNPWDLGNLVSYDDAYLSGFRAESYHVTLPEGFEAAKKLMAPAIESSIRRDIGGDEQRIHSATTQYRNITFKHLLLPVWMSAYRFHEKTYRIIINARTGEVQGERPYDAWKIAGAILAALVIVGILVVLSR